VAPLRSRRSLGDVVAIHADQATANGLTVVVNGADALPPPVHRDKARFDQSIGNLIGNAVACTLAGSVNISARWHGDSARFVVIEVADSGPGIDPARMPQISDAFVLEPRRGSRSSGLGLGLHIFRRLTELMNGRIDYCPTPGGGSLFRIALALDRRARPPPVRAMPDPAQRVLLVEDDAITREVTCARLTRLGHAVTTAADVKTALAVAGEAINLILLDINIANAADTGLSAARRVR
jgi:hypothetical protein